MPNYQRRRRLLGASVLFACMIVLLRWEGYYGLMPVAPWPWAIGMSGFITVLMLRVWVLINRYMW